MELLICELGRWLQPLQENYEAYGHLVTRSWLKAVWGKAWAYGIEVQVNNVPLEFPREGDAWLLPMIEGAGYGRTELERINRVRIHQQVLFLSDVLCAGGRYLDPRYLEPRPLEE